MPCKHTTQRALLNNCCMGKYVWTQVIVGGAPVERTPRRDAFSLVLARACGVLACPLRTRCDCCCFLPTPRAMCFSSLYARYWLFLHKFTKFKQVLGHRMLAAGLPGKALAAYKQGLQWANTLHLNCSHSDIPNDFIAREVSERVIEPRLSVDVHVQSTRNLGFRPSAMFQSACGLLVCVTGGAAAVRFAQGVPKHLPVPSPRLTGGDSRSRS